VCKSSHARRPRRPEWPAFRGNSVLSGHAAVRPSNAVRSRHRPRGIRLHDERTSEELDHGRRPWRCGQMAVATFQSVGRDRRGGATWRQRHISAGWSVHAADCAGCLGAANFECERREPDRRKRSHRFRSRSRRCSSNPPGLVRRRGRPTLLVERIPCQGVSEGVLPCIPPPKLPVSKCARGGWLNEAEC